MPLQIALLGCGAIGRMVAQRARGLNLVACYDRIPERADQLGTLCGATPYHDFLSFLAHPCDLVVEAASVEAVGRYAETLLKLGRHLVLMSVGALADPLLKQRLVECARAHRARIHIPSGALFGLDNLKIGQVEPLSRVTLRTTKPAAALDREVTEPTLVFQGSAQEGIARFPRNVNVAVALSLATGAQVEMELWADPEARHNTHQVEVAGSFGQATLTTVNLPCADNPATSCLAALSLLALLHNLDNPLVIGG